MLNPYFLQGSKSEQGLLQSLMNESIRMHGIDVYYIPRFYITKKKVIREVIESEFNNAFPIEAYVDSYDGYEGAGTLLTKFGVQPYNDLSLIISKERYENYIQPLIENLPHIELATRPKEGDLIYFPLGDRLFEIKFVEHEQPFYQLKKTYVYNLRCELFRYEDEIIDTGVEFIDDSVDTEGYKEILRLIGSGSTASATATIVNGGVREVIVTNRGSKYKTAPSVQFSTSPINSPNATATGIATMIGGIVDICSPDEYLYRVQGVFISNSGFGYTQAPSVSFQGGGGSGAEAHTKIGDGIVGIVSVTNFGSGYTKAPQITFVGYSSVSAAATAIMNIDSISQILITNSGLGYTQAPQIIIEPPYMSGSGNYEFNEEVSGSISGSTARVKDWNSTTKELSISNITGNFKNGELIVGQSSNASYKLYQNIPSTTSNLFADNVDIQIEANKVIDFSETNPFGTP